jgi:hypothetical protein
MKLCGRNRDALTERGRRRRHYAAHKSGMKSKLS